MKVLLTGGAGYIGSHTCVSLVAAGHAPVILDDYSNSHPEVVERIARIVGQTVPVVQGDVGDADAVRGILERHQIDAVAHLAAFKAANQSLTRPLAYYRNNVASLIRLLEAMDDAECRTMVFSGSATVYGEGSELPIPEGSVLRSTTPYGHTKLIGETILSALQVADPRWRVGIARFFNPAGAHDSGLIGEDPVGAPTNLFPRLARVAAGIERELEVFGHDFATPDGTGVRDYIHVMDVADGHVALLEHLVAGGEGLTVNLGTGQGHSVLQALRAFEAASGRSIPHRFAPRRPGDPAVSYCDPSLALARLGWRARRSLDDICASAWRWQSRSSRGRKPTLVA